MIRRAWLLSVCSTAVSGYETKWYTQSLTHVPSDSRTFAQRYLVETHGNNAVLFYSGNEGPITDFWASAGFLHYLGAKLGAVVLFAEARYYGESVPAHDVKWLKTELILADYANLVTQIVPPGSPVVVFGAATAARSRRFCV